MNDGAISPADNTGANVIGALDSDVGFDAFVRKPDGDIKPTSTIGARVCSIVSGVAVMGVGVGPYVGGDVVDTARKIDGSLSGSSCLVVCEERKERPTGTKVIVASEGTTIDPLSWIPVCVDMLEV